MTRARERKRGRFLHHRLFCPKDFFSKWVLSRCIGYLIHFQNILLGASQLALSTGKYTSRLHTLFCLFLKSSKTFSASLRKKRWSYLNILTLLDACCSKCFIRKWGIVNTSTSSIVVAMIFDNLKSFSENCIPPVFWLWREWQSADDNVTCDGSQTENKNVYV